MLYCEKCGEWVEHYPMFGRKQRCLMCNSKLRKESKIKIDISKLEKQMRIRDALTENPDIKPSIQCDKCHKQIEYNYYSGYSHRCSGRVDEIRRAAHKRLYSINSLQNRDAQIFGMYDLANDLDSASVVYDPTANKLSRKDIEMNNQQEQQALSRIQEILEDFEDDGNIEYAKLALLNIVRQHRREVKNAYLKLVHADSKPDLIKLLTAED